MRSIVGKLYRRVNLLTFSLVLATSGISAAVPLFLSQNASAISGVTYSTSGFNNFSWGVDRSLPSGGHLVSGDSLSMTVDGNNPGSDNFEGLKAALPAGTTTISANLLVDSSWATKDVIAGMWGQATNEAYVGTSDYNAWPTLEFNNVDNAASVDVWDTFTGHIEGVTTVPYGSTIQLEIAVDPASGTFTYYLNGNDIYHSSNLGYKPLTNVIFNNYNISDSYTTFWTNFRTGKQNTSAPTNLTVSHNGTNVASGTTVGSSFISGNTVLNFNPVADTNAYVTETTTPNNTFEVWNGYNNTWLINGGTPSQGEFSTHGDGTYSYRVKTRSATTGLWSAWSGSVSLIYDATKPDIAVASPATSGATVNDTSSITINAQDNIGLSKISFQIYQGATALSDNSNALVGKYAVKNTTASSDTLTRTIGSFGLPDGTYSIKATATDRAGNYSLVQNFSFTVDSHSPVVTIDGVAPKAFYNKSTGISAHVIDDNYAKTEIYHSGDLAPFKTYTGDWFGLDWLNDGSYHLVAIDAAGNEMAYDFTIDSAIPNISNLVLTKTLTNDNSVSVTGTISDANLKDYHYQIVDSSKHNVLGEYSWSKVGGTGSITNGSLLTADISTLKLDGTHVAPLPDGNYYVRVWADDLAGNRAGISAPQYYLPFTIDTTAPTLTALDYVGTNTTPTITGTTNSSTDVVTVDGNAATVDTSANGAGTYDWSYVLTVQPIGAQVTVISTDLAGNPTSPEIVNVTIEPASLTTTTTTTQNTVAPQAVNNNLGTPAVLGAQTDAATTDTTQTPAADALGTPDVKGASTQLATTTTPSLSSTGLAWYWWVLIVAAVVSFIWWLIARLRNRANVA